MNKWYNGDKAMSYNCVMTIVESMRSSGKSVWFLNFLCNRFKKYGEWFIYIRRREKDFELLKNDLFSDLEGLDLQQPNTFRIVGKQILYNKFGIQKDSKGRPFYDKTQDIPCGMLASFNDAARLKSLPLKKVYWLLLEEYIDESGSYVTNEPNKLMNIYKSVDRDEDRVKMILLGNTISISNPYYTYLNVKPDENVEFTFLKSRSTVIQRFKPSKELIDSKKSTRLYKLTGDTDYGKFMLGEQTMDNFDMIEYSDIDNSEPLCNVVCDENKYGVWIKGNNLYFDKQKNNLDTINLSNDIKEDISKQTILHKIIQQYIINGSCRFSNFNIKTQVLSFYKLN